jgi:hypothetical protein
MLVILARTVKRMFRQTVQVTVYVFCMVMRQMDYFSAEQH